MALPRNKARPVTVWICPKCGGFYASTNAGNLKVKWNRDAKGKKTFKRSVCPECRQRGEIVERIPYIL